MSGLSGSGVSRRLLGICLLTGLVLSLGACSFVLSEDDEYRYRKIDYPIGKKQKIK